MGGLGKRKEIVMRKPDYWYVPKRTAKPEWKKLVEILHEVQNLVRQDFTFDFTPVGSYKRNMVTYDKNSKVGFDFDVNIEVNDDEEAFSPDEIRNILRNAINQVAPRYGYSYCEDSTSVLTIKKVNTSQSRIIHSCDLAIVYECSDGRQQYIRFNKKNNNYTWEYRGKCFDGFSEKWEWLVRNGYKDDLLEYYIEKKNNNDDPNKHSRSLLAESVKELCDKFGYHR